MQASNNCVTLVQAFEGIKDGDPSTVLLEPYICDAGYATVGWGHVLHDEYGHMINVDDHGGAAGALAAARVAMLRVYGKPALSKEECVPILLDDLDKFSGYVTPLVPQNINQAQFDAITSFSFALGARTFSGSTLRKQVQDGNHPVLRTFAAAKAISFNAGAINEITDGFCAYSRIAHVWTLGLFRRRWVEASLFLNGADNLQAQISYAFTQR